MSGTALASSGRSPRSGRPARAAVSSLSGRPTSCTPSGRPPVAEARRGHRARRLAGVVPDPGVGIGVGHPEQRAQRAHALPLAPRRTGGLPVVGVTSTSTSSKIAVDPLGLRRGVALRALDASSPGSAGRAARSRACGAGAGRGAAHAATSSRDARRGSAARSSLPTPAGSRGRARSTAWPEARAAARRSPRPRAAAGRSTRARSGGLVESATRSRPGGASAGAGVAAAGRPCRAPTSSRSAVSATLRVSKPTTLSPYQCSRRRARAGSASALRLEAARARSWRPGCGSSRRRPMRVAPAARPAATAAALPPLEPPGVRVEVPGIARHAERRALGVAR